MVINYLLTATDVVFLKYNFSLKKVQVHTVISLCNISHYTRKSDLISSTNLVAIEYVP